MGELGLDYVSFIVLIKKHKMDNLVLQWAGIFRYLYARDSQGFTLKRWISLNETELDYGIASSIFVLLEEGSLLEKRDGKYIIIKERELQTFFETLNVFLNIELQFLYNKPEKLLWTIPKNNGIPKRISSAFNHLNSWIQESIQTTSNRLILFSPYFTELGIRHLMVSLKAITKNRSNLIIDWFTSDLTLSSNKKAFAYLMNELSTSNNKIRIYEPKDIKDNHLWFHAKLLLVDGVKGYMGSANFSQRAFDDQFEIGIPLGKEHSKVLTELIDYWIENGYFIEGTSKARGT